MTPLQENIGIDYTIIREADESETFGLDSVAPKKKGKYFGDIVIPSGFQESDDAYSDKYMVISVDIQAFSECPELTSVTLPASVELIQSHAFYKTPKLETVIIPYGNLTEIGLNAFYLSGIRTMKIPGSVSSIGYNAFGECPNLQEINLSANITVIDELAFNECINLEKVIFDGNFADIDVAKNAFSGCVKLYESDESSIKVNNPSIGTKGETASTILSITLSNFATIIEMSSNNTAPDGSGYYQWINIEPEAYIVADGEHYKLLDTEGIAISPYQTEYTEINQTIRFKLIFPPISKDVKHIDLIESESSSWQFKDITIN